MVAHFPASVSVSFQLLFSQNTMIDLGALKHYIIGNIPGGRLNKKDGLTRYGNSHVKDKTS